MPSDVSGEIGQGQMVADIERSASDRFGGIVCDKSLERNGRYFVVDRGLRTDLWRISDLRGL